MGQKVVLISGASKGIGARLVKGFRERGNPMNRLGTVDEIVDAVLHLESAAFVTGEILHVDGGAHAGRW